MAEEKKTTTATKTPSKTTKSTTAKSTTAKTTVKKEAVKKENVTPVKEVAPKKEVKVVEKAKKAEKQIKVTLVKSTIGYNKKQAQIVKALGLGKLNSTHTLPDNVCVRGMISKVSHLVKVEELN